jgi:hypothetical protein
LRSRQSKKPIFENTRDGFFGLATF